jgi:polysaccharide pyruvyl transferase WcaK-like protein
MSETSPLADNPALTIGVLNTSIASENAGDFIIMEAAARRIDECLPLAYKVHLTTHEKLSRASLRLQKGIAFNIACGTNLLHSHMEVIRQWKVGFVTSFYLKPVVLLGVGWRGQAKRRTTFYTRMLLRSLLSSEYLHSVRDSYTEERLRQIGIRNVVNTACATMWDLTPEHCAEVPAEQGEDVVMTLTDYSRDPERDRQLLDLLKRSYRRVYFWRQGADDLAYLATLAGTKEVEILPSSLRAYDDLLADRSLSLDYVGTRLHGGIRALQHKRRTWIIGVDHRAIENERDFHLPVLYRYSPTADLQQAIRSPAPCDVRIPQENIRRWRGQFAAATRPGNSPAAQPALSEGGVSRI